MGIRKSLAPSPKHKTGLTYDKRVCEPIHPRSGQMCDTQTCTRLTAVVYAEVQKMWVTRTRTLYAERCKGKVGPIIQGIVK